MNRVMIYAERHTTYMYRDSVHAAIVNAFRASGVKEVDVIGRFAKPWTFAPFHNAKPGGKKVLKGVTVSSSDKELGQIVARMNPRDIVWNSENGDRIDMGEGRIVSFANPVDDCGELRIKFASPFLLSIPGSKGKRWIEDLNGIDLSLAFSAGLSKRMKRDIDLKVEIDAFTLKCMAKQPVIVKLRKSKNGSILVPGFFATMTLLGNKLDLEEAYFGGLGQKTRYGFGLPVPAK